jgi:hypothetical protein
MDYLALGLPQSGWRLAKMPVQRTYTQIPCESVLHPLYFLKTSCFAWTAGHASMSLKDHTVQMDIPGLKLFQRMEKEDGSQKEACKTTSLNLVADRIEE